MRALVLRCLILACASVLLGVVGNALHPAGLALSGEVRSLAEQGQCSAPEAGGGGHGPGADAPPTLQPTLLPPREAAALRGQSGVVFGDLRPPARYALGHIAGAVHLPCAGSLGQAALAKLPRRARLVLYDEDGKSPELPTAAATALLRGVAEVIIIDGGFAGWTAAGLPAESGPCEGCAVR